MLILRTQAEKGNVERGLMAVGGHNSVIRALAAQAGDRPGFDSWQLPGSFPHSPFQPRYVCKLSISILLFTMRLEDQSYLIFHNCDLG